MTGSLEFHVEDLDPKKDNEIDVDLEELCFVSRLSVRTEGKEEGISTEAVW